MENKSALDARLKKALSLAKGGKFDEALLELRNAEESEQPMSAPQLRQAALVNSYCGRLSEAVDCWLKIEGSGEMGHGDFYMMGCLQADLSKTADAIDSLVNEIDLAKKIGNQFYLSSSVIRLADLYIKQKDKKSAIGVLSLIGDQEGDFIPGRGYTTKSNFLSELK
jgi:tetratricopeptide (TPR) repeat protein